MTSIHQLAGIVPPHFGRTVASHVECQRQTTQTSHQNYAHRPLSRRLDRCDRVIHNESGDPNGGNMCSFSGATYTSRVRHNADYVPYAKIGSTSESRQPHSQLQWRFRDKSLCTICWPAEIAELLHAHSDIARFIAKLHQTANGLHVQCFPFLCSMSSLVSLLPCRI